MLFLFFRELFYLVLSLTRLTSGGVSFLIYELYWTTDTCIFGSLCIITIVLSHSSLEISRDPRIECAIRTAEDVGEVGHFYFRRISISVIYLVVFSLSFVYLIVSDRDQMRVEDFLFGPSREYGMISLCMKDSRLVYIVSASASAEKI